MKHTGDALAAKKSKHKLVVKCRVAIKSRLKKLRLSASIGVRQGCTLDKIGSSILDTAGDALDILIRQTGKMFHDKAMDEDVATADTS